MKDDSCLSNHFPQFYLNAHLILWFLVFFSMSLPSLQDLVEKPWGLMLHFPCSKLFSTQAQAAQRTGEQMSLPEQSNSGVWTKEMQPVYFQSDPSWIVIYSQLRCRHYIALQFGFASLCRHNASQCTATHCNERNMHIKTEYLSALHSW